MRKKSEKDGLRDHSEHSPVSSDYLAICEAAKLKPKIRDMAESLDINSKTIQVLETVLVLGVVLVTTTAIGEILVAKN